MADLLRSTSIWVKMFLLYLLLLPSTSRASVRCFRLRYSCFPRRLELGRSSRDVSALGTLVSLGALDLAALLRSHSRLTHTIKGLIILTRFCDLVHCIITAHYHYQWEFHNNSPLRFNLRYHLSMEFHKYSILRFNSMYQ